MRTNNIILTAILTLAITLTFTACGEKKSAQETEAAKAAANVSVEERYIYSEDGDCKLALDIMKSQGGYSYMLQADGKTYTGKVSSYNSDDFTLEGIPWDLNSDGKRGNLENTYFMREEGGVTFQNHGDPMAPHSIFDCIGDKYVKLKKEAVSSAIGTLTNPKDGKSGGSAFTDNRDGKAYKTVKIGEQVWMAENLNYKTGDSWCYEDNEANCAKYGRLYVWETAEKACPLGWHLSTEQEWNILVSAAGGDAAGKKLKTKSGWNEGSNGTDEFGFSALPGGNRYYGESFHDAGKSGYWWTTTELKSGNAYIQYMNHNENMNGYGDSKSNGYSVRCVKDELSPNVAAESGGGGKLLKSMTTTGHDGRVETVRFEYDEQNRIVKIHETYCGTKTLQYSGNKLVKSVCSKHNEDNEDYRMEGERIEIPNDMRPVEFTLNKNGYINTYASTSGNDTRHYKNGNLIKLITNEASESESTGERIEVVSEYDSKNSPFINCKTPKWFLQYNYYTDANANNLIASTQRNYDSANKLTQTYVSEYKYEYDSEGFPTKQTETRKSDGETHTTTITFEYISK